MYKEFFEFLFSEKIELQNEQYLGRTVYYPQKIKDLLDTKTVSREEKILEVKNIIENARKIVSELKVGR